MTLLGLILLLLVVGLFLYIVKPDPAIRDLIIKVVTVVVIVVLVIWILQISGLGGRLSQIKIGL